MKTKLSMAAIAFISIMAFSSCSTKQQAINQLDSFTKELQANSGSYSLNDWKQAGERFKKVHQKLAKHDDYSFEQKKQIALLELKCANALKEGVKESAPNVLFELGTQLGDIISEGKSLFGK